MVPMSMTKPYIEDITQSLRLFSKKTAKDLFRDHNCMIICLMAGIQVVVLSVDVARVKGSTWMANPAGRSSLVKKHQIWKYMIKRLPIVLPWVKEVNPSSTGFDSVSQLRASTNALRRRSRSGADLCFQVRVVQIHRQLTFLQRRRGYMKVRTLFLNNGLDDMMSVVVPRLVYNNAFSEWRILTHETLRAPPHPPLFRVKLLLI